MTIFSHDKKGFTLLETMMAIGISGIVILMIATLSKQGMVHFGKINHSIDRSLDHYLIRKFLLQDLLRSGPSYNYVVGDNDYRCLLSDNLGSGYGYWNDDFWMIFEFNRATEKQQSTVSSSSTAKKMSLNYCIQEIVLQNKGDEFKFLIRNLKGYIRYRTPDIFNSSIDQEKWQFGKSLFCSFLFAKYPHSIVKVTSLSSTLRQGSQDLGILEKRDYAIMVKVDSETTCSIVNDRDLYPISEPHLSIKDFIENIPSKSLSGAGLLFFPVHLIKYRLQEDLHDPKKLNLYRIKYDYDALSTNDKKKEIMLVHNIKELKFKRNNINNYLVHFNYQFNELIK